MTEERFFKTSFLSSEIVLIIFYAPDESFLFIFASPSPLLEFFCLQKRNVLFVFLMLGVIWQEDLSLP